MPRSCAVPEEFDGSGRIVPSGRIKPTAPQYYLPSSDDNRLREASRLVGLIRATSALFAGFAYSQLSPLTTGSPFTGTLYLTLDAAAVGCELVAVFVAQQLLYRLYDGTFGAPKGEEGQAASVLGLLVSMHRLEFRTVRLSFISGIVCLLACTIIRAWASFGAERALPVTVMMMTAGATMAYFALRSQQQVFNDL